MRGRPPRRLWLVLSCRTFTSTCVSACTKMLFLNDVSYTFVPSWHGATLSTGCHIRSLTTNLLNIQVARLIAGVENSSSMMKIALAKLGQRRFFAFLFKFMSIHCPAILEKDRCDAILAGKEGVCLWQAGRDRGFDFSTEITADDSSNPKRLDGKRTEKKQKQLTW